MKKLFALGIALTLIFALCVPAFADNGISTPGGSASVPINLTSTPAVFLAEVPTSFPVSVDENGNVTVADNLRITNYSKGQIKVSSIEVSGCSPWQLTAYDTDFASEKTDADKFGMMFNGKAVASDGTADLSGFGPINGNGYIAVNYGMALPNLSQTLTSSHIADAVITLSWNT